MRYPQVTSLWSDYPRLLLKCVPFRDYLVTRSVNSVSSVDSVGDKSSVRNKNKSVRSTVDRRH